MADDALSDDALWLSIQHGLNRMISDQTPRMSYAEYSILYTSFFNYIMVNAHVHRRLVYSNIYELLEKRLEGIKDGSDLLSGDALLNYYAEEWNRFTMSSKSLDKFFNYLNRHWVEDKDRRCNTYTICELAHVKWHSVFLLKIHLRLAHAMLLSIQDLRTDVTRDLRPVKRVLSALDDFALTMTNFSGNSAKGDSKKYFQDYVKTANEQLIEAPALRLAREQYQQFSRSLRELATHSIPGFLARVEQYFQEEQAFLEHYPVPRVREELVNTCGSLLLGEQVESLRMYFRTLLQEADRQQLQGLYASLARIPGGVELVCDTFKGYITDVGLTATTSLVAVSGEPPRVNPQAYVDTLLGVRDTCTEVLEYSFKSDARLATALDNVQATFVNYNAATRGSKQASCQLLVDCVDAILQNAAGDEGSDLNIAVDRVMSLFVYLDDKDVFRNLYQLKMSKRLIYTSSVSHDAEMIVLAKLKNACGFDFVQGLDRMLIETTGSRELTRKFKEQEQSDDAASSVDLGVLVIGSAVWPARAPSQSFTPPPDILLAHDRFQRYYSAQTWGRRLTWLWNNSWNELQTNYLSKPYTLVTSTYQMAILAQYNSGDDYSLSELATNTSISEDALVGLIRPLTDLGILKDVAPDRFCLNMDFRSEEIRFDLKASISAEVESETVEVLKEVERHRHHAYRYAIVRIMRVAKKLERRTLVEEVAAQLASRFSPLTPDIEEEIERLVEDEYMVYDPNMGNDGDSEQIVLMYVG